MLDKWGRIRIIKMRGEYGVKVEVEFNWRGCGEMCES